METLVIFGSHPRLSLAELLSWGEANLLSFTVLEQSGEVARIQGIPEDARHALATTLAGVVKIGAVVHRSAALGSAREDELVEKIFDALMQDETTTKLTFGLSFYGAPAAIPDARTAKRIGLELKKRLHGKFHHVRWVAPSPRSALLSSVQVHHNKLLGSGGAEVLVCMSGESMTFAITSAVQPFAAWSARDYGRPRRNAKQGMLPPKLARLMVNLLGLPPKGTLLDPFCGSGTVLMEAALLGWPLLIGADFNPTAIHDTEKNFSWLAKQTTEIKSKPPTLLVTSIRQLPSRLPKASVRAIVTEPSLGEPQRRPPSFVEAKNLAYKLLPLYRDLFLAASALLELNGRLVVALPRWKLNTGEDYVLPLLENVATLPAAFRLYDPLRHLPPSQRGPLVYRRPDQIVGRELMIFEKAARTLIKP